MITFYECVCVNFFALQKSFKAEKSPSEKKFPFSFLYRGLPLEYYPAKFSALCFHFFSHTILISQKGTLKDSKTNTLLNK